jgi:hypothetical protein
LLLATRIQSTKYEILSEKNKIWVSIDETSDIDSRFVANVVGTLKHEQPGEICLLACEVLGRVNNSPIAVVFENAMNLQWPNTTLCKSQSMINRWITTICDLIRPREKSLRGVILTAAIL